jgi:hypothetical protein
MKHVVAGALALFSLWLLIGIVLGLYYAADGGQAAGHR